MILSNQEIINRSELSDPPLLSPIKHENVRGASYDLTIGDEIYLSKVKKSSFLETTKLDLNQTFEIAAHEICFILTEENIQLPKNIAAKISLRMTHIYKGLVLTTQPPFDPGYNGKAIVMVHNLSSQSIHLKRGERIASIEFFELKEASTNVSVVHQSVSELQAQLQIPVTSSLMGIHFTAQSAKKWVWWLAGANLTILTTLIAFAGLTATYSHYNMKERVDDNKKLVTEAEDNVSKHTKTIEHLLNELKGQKQRIGDMQREINDQEKDIEHYKDQFDSLKRLVDNINSKTTSTP